MLWHCPRTERPARWRSFAHKAEERLCVPLAPMPPAPARGRWKASPRTRAGARPRASCQRPRRRPQALRRAAARAGVARHARAPRDAVRALDADHVRRDAVGVLQADARRRRGAAGLSGRRRDAGVRTTNETRDAIELLRRTTGCIASLSALRNGAEVRDLQASIRCASSLLGLWQRVSSLAPHVSPRAAALHRLMRSALEAVELRPHERVSG